MVTNIERYEERHRQICKRAEQDFLEQRADNPKFTVPKAVKSYAAAVHHAIQRRDCIAAVYAIAAAHLALKMPLD
jgi:hypothetical protein